jgi:hypothetical protein
MPCQSKHVRPLFTNTLKYVTFNALYSDNWQPGKTPSIRVDTITANIPYTVYLSVIAVGILLMLISIFVHEQIGEKYKQPI